MLILAIIIAIIEVCTILSLIVSNMPRSANKSKEYNFEDSFKAFNSQYSVKEYLERIENENAKILKENEAKEKYSIVLWWGLDGLRTNDDDSLEWIKKTVERKQTSISGNELLEFINGAMNLTPQSVLQSMVSRYMDTQCKSTFAQLQQGMCQCTQSKIQSLLFSQAQQAQNTAILSAIFNNENTTNPITQTRWCQ